MSISNHAVRGAKPAPELSAKCCFTSGRKRIPQSGTRYVRMSDNASMQVEVEKELRRQLLEVDEHSSHQGRQLERLQEHTVAMHALAPGMPPALPGLYTSFCIASYSPCGFPCIFLALLPCMLCCQSCYHCYLACTAVTLQPLTPWSSVNATTSPLHAMSLRTAVISVLRVRQPSCQLVVC